MKKIINLILFLSLATPGIIFPGFGQTVSDVAGAATSAVGSVLVGAKDAAVGIGKFSADSAVLAYEHKTKLLGLSVLGMAAMAVDTMHKKAQEMYSKKKSSFVYRGCAHVMYGASFAVPVLGSIAAYIVAFGYSQPEVQV